MGKQLQRKASETQPKQVHSLPLPEPLENAEPKSLPLKRLRQASSET
jgi:hypothetical protein